MTLKVIGSTDYFMLFLIKHTFFYLLQITIPPQKKQPTHTRVRRMDELLLSFHCHRVILLVKNFKYSEGT
jgi:hypothetical protein